jgi:hypothetical protein
MSMSVAVIWGISNAILAMSLLNQWRMTDHLRKIEEHLADMRRREKARR